MHDEYFYWSGRKNTNYIAKKAQLDVYAVVCSWIFYMDSNFSLYAGNACLSILTLLGRAERKMVIVEDACAYFALQGRS